MGADGLPAAYKPLDASGSIKNVVTTTSFKVSFDRFLLPATTYRQSICVQSRLQLVRNLQDCTEPVFFETTYDPVHREITYRQSADMTRPHLAPNTTYQVTLFPAGGRDFPGGVSAFDGAPLEGMTTFTFSTGEAAPPGARVDELPEGDFFCASVLPPLQRCSYSTCHYDDSMGMGAAQGLDMSSAERVARTALGRTAHGSQTGEHASAPESDPLRFGRAMPIIDPGFPANSYLVYKLLTSRENTRSLSDPPSDAELARLHASFVVGMPMPPTNAQHAALTAPELDALIAWIFAGAPIPSACP